MVRLISRQRGGLAALKLTKLFGIDDFPAAKDYYNYIFSNYWMRLSRIWRILQIKEDVIHRGRRARWITPSEICRLLHILRKPNSIIALLFIQNISSFLKGFRHYALCSRLHFWRHFDVIGSIIFGGLHFNVTDSIWRRFFPNLVNSSWLWRIMRVILTN